MITLYYQLCVNSQIYTDFVQVSPLNLCSTSWSRSYKPCCPFAKRKRLKCSSNWNFYLPTYFTGQLSDYRSSLIQAFMTTRILRFLKRHIFFLRFGWDSTTGMVIKIALCLELFRFLQFIVKQDESSLCSSSSQLHSPRGESTTLARLGLFARSTKTAMLRAGYKFIFFCRSLQRWERHCWERWQRHGSMPSRDSTTFRECNTLQLTS